MALVNHAKREINAKIVYYGPEKVGKATSLRYVYERIKSSLRGELKLLPTSGSSLLFFDFSPFEQPVFGGYRVRLHIYTLQGKVTNPAAWKMTLKGADGLVFVADASPSELSVSCESLLQLRDFLGSYGVGLHDVPFVLQLNKKDLAGQISVEEAARSLGLPACPSCLTSASNGEGVLETLTTLSRLIMERIGKREDLQQSDVASSAENNAPPKKEREQSVGVVDNLLPGVPISADEEPSGSIEPDGLVPHTHFVPTVSLAEEGLHVDGTTIRIPLDISKPGGMQRVVVAVTVSTE